MLGITVCENSNRYNRISFLLYHYIVINKGIFSFKLVKIELRLKEFGL